MPEFKKITIRDVAREAGVSMMTVTRMFHNGSISPATRDKVLRAADRLHYQPDLGARILRGCRTMSVGVLFSNPAGIHAPIVRSAALALLKKHYVSYIADTLGDPEITRMAIADFQSRHVDAVILDYVPFFEPLLDCLETVPNLIISNHYGMTPPLERDCCGVDWRDAILEVLSQAAAAGRRNVLWMSTLKRDSELAEIGCRLGLKIRLADLAAYPIDPEYGHQVRLLDDWLQKGSETPDLIVTDPDIAAVKIIEHLRKSGLRVPEDVGVICCEETRLTRYASVPVGTIHEQLPLKADKLVELVLNRLENPDSPIRKESIKAEFISRTSCLFDCKSVRGRTVANKKK